MVGDSCWMLIDAAPDSAVVAEIWHRMAHGPRLDALVAGLLQFGFGFLPDFALLMAADERRHVICRGGGRATLVTASGGSTGIDGAGLATWLDYPVPPDAATIVLGEPPAESGLRLPAAAGIFLASGVIVSLADEAAALPLSSGSLPVTPSPNVTSLHPFPASSSPAGLIGPGPGPAAALPAEQDPSGPGADEGAPDDRAYDFLWEHTQMRSVEDAAIRPDSGDSLFSLQVPDFGTGGFAGQESGAGGFAGQDFAVEGFGAPDFAALHPGAPGGPADFQPSRGGQPGLIDSVPGWAVPAPGQPRLPALIQGDTEPVEPPVSQAKTTIAGGLGGTGELPENTATTIRRGELRPPVPVPAVEDQIGPTVHALVCMRSHLSPPSSAECRVCGEPLPQQDPVIVPRPPLGILRLSAGDVITLNQGVVMGRNPRAEFDGDERLHMVKLPGGDGDISRTHVKVTLDGWHVLVTDMKSTNGTLVELPGRPPERLRAAEPVPIPHGTVVTLADGIYFRFEVTE